MKKERIYTESCIEVSIRKEAKEQIQALAACQNIDVEQVSEELVRCGLEIYLAEQAAGQGKRMKR
jgi:hypothetical protein